MSTEEALKYLKLRKIDEEQAAQIYKLVGGRMTHLKFFADEIKGTGSFDGMFTACRKENLFLTPFRDAPDDV